MRVCECVCERERGESVIVGKTLFLFILVHRIFTIRISGQIRMLRS